MHKKPTVHQSTCVAQSHLFRIETVDLEFSNGEKRQYERLSSHGEGGAVLIVPMLDDETVLLIREYAAGTDQYELALPKGKLKKGEAVFDAANREIMEEVGYEAADFRLLKTVSLAPTYMTYHTHLVLAQNLSSRKEEGDEPEEIEVVPWSIHNIDELLLRDDFSEAKYCGIVFSQRGVGLMLNVDLQTLSQQVRQVAQETGRIIMSVRDKGFSTERKEDDSPVTEADLKASQYIVKSLSNLTPEFPVLSEESEEVLFQQRHHWDTFWLVDPLDGTRSFVNGYDEFAVCISLIHQHESVLGVVHSPVNDEGYLASRGNGAYKYEQHKLPYAIQVRSMQMPPHIFINRTPANEHLLQFLDNVGEHTVEKMSSALKFCRIAEGQGDLFARMGNYSEWDIAAAQCILEEAGGQLTDTKMRAIRYNTKDDLLTPPFFVFGKKSRDWSRYSPL